MIRALCWLLIASACGGCVRWSPPSMAPVSSDAPCRAGSVTWVSPDDARERRRLDTWCAGVGPPVIESATRAASPQPLGLQDITFVSWNVHVGNGDIRAFVKDLRAGLHTRNRAVEHAVLLLQEAVRTESVPAFADAASGAARIASPPGDVVDIVRISHELGLSLIYLPSMRNGRSAADPATDRGSAILSTMPLSEPTAIELPGERQRRVVILSKAGPISVGVIHLDALGAANRLWMFWTPWMRARQIRSIGALLPDGPLVLGADLNTWHGIDEPAVRLLEKLPESTPVTADRQGLGLRVLDYFFFRAGTTRRAHYRQLDRYYGSDHRPLIGWIE